MPLFQRRDSGEVHARIVANCGVRAPARLDTDHAVRRKRVVADKKLRILARVNVIGHNSHGETVAKPLAEPEHKHRLSRADRSANTESKCAHDMNSLSNAFSWRMLAISRRGLKQPACGRCTSRESRRMRGPISRQPVRTRWQVSCPIRRSL